MSHPGIMDFMRDSDFVWRFQNYFGVEKVAEIKGDDDSAAWEALDARDMPHLCEGQREGNKETGRRRGKTVKSNGDGSSGYSSGEEDRTNVTYYRITNYFWYILFFIGSQLGDEGFYALFFRPIYISGGLCLSIKNEKP